MSHYEDFRQRAQEYFKLEKRARTAHDRQFFHQMAMAWLGRTDESEEKQRQFIREDGSRRQHH